VISIASESPQKSQVSLLESPIHKNARDLLRNLKSCSTEKKSQKSDESKLDKLELQLLALISEQEKEVTRL